MHSGLTESEEADALTKIEANLPMMGPEPAMSNGRLRNSKKVAKEFHNKSWETLTAVDKQNNLLWSPIPN